MSNKEFPLKIGLFGIGLDAYWEQFSGLKERLESYISVVSGKMKAYNVEVVNFRLIDTAPKETEAGHLFRQEDVDITFSCKTFHTGRVIQILFDRFLFN